MFIHKREMVKGVGVSSMQKNVISIFLPSQVRQYLVVGREHPSEKDPNPTLFRIRVFAPNPVLAKTKFWYFMKR